jgi:predicted P-loop ATPase
MIDTARLLAGVDLVELINRYVPLKKNGPEWEACCPFHTEATPSFKVNPVKGFYHCFGCGAHGDAIKFLQEHQGLEFKAACAVLGAADDDEAKPVVRAAVQGEKTPAKRSDWGPLPVAPEDAPPPPVAHIKRGKPQFTWRYTDAEGRTAGYVCRFLTSDGGKEVLPLTFCEHAESGARDWRWNAFATPRPLYQLHALAQRPEATVLLVEGEKCAEAAQAELPELVVTTWPGGGKAVSKADFAPLAGRKVMLWADCDAKRKKLSPEQKAAGEDPLAQPLLPEDEQPGVQAMHAAREALLALGCRVWLVRIPAPGEKPDGWDVADAIAEGLRGVVLAEFLRAAENRVECVREAEKAPDPTEAGAGKKKRRAEEAPFIPDLTFRKGEIAACLANVYQILAHHPDWAGVVGFNEFSLATEKLKAPPFEGGELGEWNEQDDSYTAMWLTRTYNVLPSSATVAEAIEALARRRKFHPVREWLRGLKWDGTPRLEHWLTDYLNAPGGEYTAKIGAWFVMGAVKRVFEPGCKFDYCLVLQGPQGRGKSAAMRILGGDWFGDTDLDLGHKDGMSALRGKWIYEIAEMGALARSEERRQKSFLSRQRDEYRPVYGRREIRAPRQVVFAGTTNEWEWNKDPTGGRRFWPVDVDGDFNLAALEAAREQLFAEAVVRVDAKERMYPTAAEQRALFDPQQLAVEQQDSLVDAFHDWVYQQYREFSLAEACMDGLKLDASKLTRDLQTRAGIALRKLGCDRVEKRNGMVRFWYKPPVRNGAESSGHEPAQRTKGGDHVPF